MRICGGGETNVAAGLPVHACCGLAANVTVPIVEPGPQQVHAQTINPILQTFPPEEIKVEY